MSQEPENTDERQDLAAAAKVMSETLKAIDELLVDWPTIRALSAVGAQRATEKKVRAQELIANALAKVEHLKLGELPAEGDEDNISRAPGM